MTYNNIKYAILALLMAFEALTSCIDDDFVCVENGGETLEEFGYTDGYAINLAVTLDKMGGTRGAASSVEELTERENYIDPEKFRVLFFDDKDKFLFESKSRWIKQLTSIGSENSQWLVSVPIYTFGNDEEYDWDWEAIREALTAEGKTFKIAILANRPGQEWCIDYDAIGLSQDWYDNAGPYWGREQTIWYANKHGGTAKDVFDLHHSQYDPIYTAKSRPSGYSGSEGFYEFVMGEENGNLTMSSTSSWVDFGEKDTGNRDSYGWNRRHFVQPSMDHPIPMYGIQKFNTIQNWVKGTPFNLSRLSNNEESTYDFQSIALLRSVVRLDLVMPKSKDYEVEFVVMGYPNVYARCEPMDVWTPTDQLWKGVHKEDGGNDGICEWNDIVKYGPVSRIYDTKSNSTLLDYQKRLCWFYGSWLEKGWDFGSLGKSVVEEAVVVNGSSPRIFNPCIQRNNVVFCGKDVDMTDQYNDGNYHYVVYTGERNVNDPTNLMNLGANGSGSATIIYWGICIKTKNSDNTDTYKFYKVPLTDLGQAGNVSQIIASESLTKKIDGTFEKEPATGMQSYENLVQDPDDETPKPWPLMRNHVYTTTIIPAGSHTWNFKVVNADNLNADPNWSNAWGAQTVYLSRNNGILTNNNGNGHADVNWGWSGTTTLERNSSSSFETEDNSIIKIDETDYSPIITGKGADDRTTMLRVPNTKDITKFTLYSYINKAPTYETMTLIDYPASTGGISVVENGTATINSSIKFTHSTAVNGVILNHSFRRGDKIEIVSTVDGGDNSKQSKFAFYSKSSEDALSLSFEKDKNADIYTVDNNYTNLFLGCSTDGAEYSWIAANNSLPAKGATLISKTNAVEVKTVYQTAFVDYTHPEKVDNTSLTKGIQVRAAGDPSADDPTGGDNGGNTTPLVVTAKKNLEITFYFRRQSQNKNGVYDLDGSKDLKCYSQNGAQYVSVEEILCSKSSESTDYGFVKKTYRFVKGGIYTIYGKGTTICLHAFIVKELPSAEELPAAMLVDQLKVTRTSKVPMTEAYWSEVAGKEHNSYETGMNAFSGEGTYNKDTKKYIYTESNYDKYVCNITDNPHLITFTSSNCGEQFCYVAAVEVKDNTSTQDYWSYLNSISHDDPEKNEELKANTLPLGELSGLKFQYASSGSISLYDTKSETSGKLRLTNVTFQFPEMRKGYTITMKGQASGSGTIAPSEGFDKEWYIFGTTQSECTWTVTSNTVTPTFTVTGTIDFYEFRIDAPSSSGVRSTRSADSVGSEFMIKTENSYSKKLGAD